MVGFCHGGNLLGNHCDQGGGRNVGRRKRWRLQWICQAACCHHSQEWIFCIFFLHFLSGMFILFTFFYTLWSVLIYLVFSVFYVFTWEVIKKGKSSVRLTFVKWQYNPKYDNLSKIFTNNWLKVYISYFVYFPQQKYLSSQERAWDEEAGGHPLWARVDCQRDARPAEGGHWGLGGHSGKSWGNPNKPKKQKTIKHLMT